MLLFCFLVFLSFIHSSSSETLAIVSSFYPKTKNSDGSMEVVIRTLVSSRDCGPSLWQCFSGVCGNQTSSVSHVIYKDENEYCQVEQISTLQVPTNAPFEIRSNVGEREVKDISNAKDKSRNLTAVDLRTRSDTGKSNSSPQTSMLPIVRVPVNCQRKYGLLKFDPDGDDMFCSFMTISQLKCDNCDPGVLIPIMFRSEPCSVLYTPNLIQSGDMLKVDFIMEDYPKASMNMTATNGAQETLEFYNTISKVPIQFIFTVDPAVPDCEEGLYLPKYLPPTPDHEARVYTAVQQSIAIFIQFTANYSSFSELLHNGPLNMTVERTRLKEHALVWIPTEEEIGHHPVCYVLLVTTPVGKHQSELRCLVVTVVKEPKFLSMTPANGTSLSVTVNQPIILFIDVETPTKDYELVVSGPNNMTKSRLGSGLFLLRWTPTDAEAGKTFSITFSVIFSNFIFSPDPLSNYYQSEIRTITVTVKKAPPKPVGSVFLRTKIISATPLSKDFIQNSILNQLKEELVNSGLTPQITLRLVSHRKIEETPPK